MALTKANNNNNNMEYREMRELMESMWIGVEDDLVKDVALLLDIDRDLLKDYVVSRLVRQWTEESAQTDERNARFAERATYGCIYAGCKAVMTVVLRHARALSLDPAVCAPCRRAWLAELVGRNTGGVSEEYFQCKTCAKKAERMRQALNRASAALLSSVKQEIRCPADPGVARALTKLLETEIEAAAAVSKEKIFARLREAIYEHVSSSFSSSSGEEKEKEEDEEEKKIDAALCDPCAVKMDLRVAARKGSRELQGLVARTKEAERAEAVREGRGWSLLYAGFATVHTFVDSNLTHLRSRSGGEKKQMTGPVAGLRKCPGIRLNV